MKRRTAITFVTCDGLPDLDPDDRLVLNELAGRGVACGISIWDCTSINWADAGVCVVRSTWDYHLKYAKFLDWIDKLDGVTELENSASLLRWNTDKRYLHDLERKGVPIIPTTWFDRGQKAELEPVLEQHGYRRAVVKPTVGLSTYGVKAVTAGNLSDGHYFNELLMTNDVMVQPYIDSVTTYGERALVFIAGEYMHAIRKTAFKHLAVAGQAGEQVVDASDSELEFASMVLNTLSEIPLYARIDMVQDRAGDLRLMELELVEPSLYMSMQPQSVSRFADALIARAGRRECKLS